MDNSLQFLEKYLATHVVADNSVLKTLEKYLRAKESNSGNLDKLREEFDLSLRPHLEKIPIEVLYEVKNPDEIIFYPRTFDDFVTIDLNMQNLITYAAYIAKTDFSVLLQGETGTGKEIFAKSIWASSKRKEAPFIEVNCASIPGSLFESEMFGIGTGVATGVTNRIGKFEAANNGTLFLDEIGELAMENQSKLLRVLQERKVTIVGSNKPKDVNFRLICATSKNLPDYLNTEFRSDLFYRINNITLNLPSLRKRDKRDIEALLNHFLKLIKKDNPEYNNIKFDKSVINILKEHKWPGNVRQLQSFVHQATLTADFLGKDIDENIMNICLELHQKEKINSDEIVDRFDSSTNDVSIDLSYKNLFSVEFFEGFVLNELLKLIRKEYLKKALALKGHQSKAGKLLGCSQSTINRWMDEFKLSEDNQ